MEILIFNLFAATVHGYYFVFISNDPTLVFYWENDVIFMYVKRFHIHIPNLIFQILHDSLHILFTNALHVNIVYFEFYAHNTLLHPPLPDKTRGIDFWTI